MIHTVQLGQAAGRFRERGVEILVIGPGGPERERWLARLIRAPYRVLADREREVFRAYGYARRIVSLIQQSGIALVDQAGRVRYVRRSTSPFGALDMDELERAIEALPRD
jgi:alkyl hydroperoxide reductase subunit AhpC